MTDVIRAYLENHPFTKDSDAMRDLNLLFSRQTYSRLCKELDLQSYIASSKFGLRGFHISDRLNWCLAREDWGLEDWRAIIFSDKFPFSNSTKARVLIRRNYGRRNDSKYVRTYQPRTASVSLHGFITYNGVGSLTPTTFNLDSEFYCHEILEPAFEWLDNHLDYYWIWQKDNCPIHVSDWSIEYLTRNMRYPDQILDWPARSPDLNIIENVWAMMSKSRIGLLREVPLSRPNDLIELANSIWNDLSVDYIQDLYRSMSKRVRAAINADGALCKY